MTLRWQVLLRGRAQQLVLRPCLIALLSLASSACDGSSETSARQQPGAQASAEANAPVPFSAALGDPDLLLTWVDADGRFQFTQAAAEIPDASRKTVRVVVSGKPPGTETLVYVGNLLGLTEGQTIPLRSMTRSEWEALGLKYRRAVVSPLEEKLNAMKEALPQGVDAIVYGASWCGACKSAEAYLKKKGLAVLRRDIEKEDDARQEMRAKLKSAGLGGSSIPVLDVGGTVLVGFSPPAIDAAIKRAAPTKKPG